MIYILRHKTYVTMVGITHFTPPKNGRLDCYKWNEKYVCYVSCLDGYVPERPHAFNYVYNPSTDQWETWPPRYEYPWADCVKAGE